MPKEFKLETDNLDMFIQTIASYLLQFKNAYQLMKEPQYWNNGVYASEQYVLLLNEPIHPMIVSYSSMYNGIKILKSMGTSPTLLEATNKALSNSSFIICRKWITTITTKQSQNASILFTTHDVSKTMIIESRIKSLCVNNHSKILESLGVYDDNAKLGFRAESRFDNQDVNIDISHTVFRK